MLTKIPVAACPLDMSKILKADRRILHQEVKEATGHKYHYFLNTGTSALLCALEALKKISPRTEVIMPAYTSHNIYIAIKQADLTPVLCDISINDLNIDLAQAAKNVRETTLCLIAVHSFGIPLLGLDEFKKRFPHIFIIEDCAQSMGSLLNNRPLGHSSDISLFSFNRGKNITSYSGGLLATSRKDIALKIHTVLMQYPKQTTHEKITNTIKVICLAIAVNPYIYKALDPILKHLKEKGRPKHIDIKHYSHFQEKIITALLEQLPILSRRRYENGLAIIEYLHTDRGLTVPRIPQDSLPAFNRMPIVVNDISRLMHINKKLAENGIESSPMYRVPMHYLFPSGHNKKDFPVSIHVARHLVTVPTHPDLTGHDLRAIIKAIKE